ncbi:capsular biosynthesis protein [Erythrobacter sp. HI0037]|nr:capsular biosynthesis protein [Erythrobacter sp. HI0020]KZY12376.1 capsular biosynthesis protein [Erythrobacter sp. HI0037]KZY20691.1 capsular biosynthesis protein [Erythrobacter sp. HI0038]
MSSWIVEPLLALPRLSKRGISIAVDAALCTLSVWLAYYLRLGDFVSLAGRPTLAVVVSIALAVPMFVVFGLYRAVLRYAGQEIAWATIRACASYGVLYATIFTGYGVEGIPRTVGIIQPLLLFALVYLSRVSARSLLGGTYRKLTRPSASDSTLIYGAGLAGQQLYAAITSSGSMTVIGFLDDDRSLHGRTIGGISVYAPHSLGTLLSRFEVSHVLLAIPSASRARRNEIISFLREAQVEVRTLPDVLDLAHGVVRVDDLRPLSVEDLLRRNPVCLDSERLPPQIQNRVVMVTGAGGSIGSELTRQVASLGPSKLLLIEANEYALYSIHRELEGLDLQGCTLVPLLASVTDRDRMDRIFKTWRPHQIYHAAAYKHVPIVEHNIVEGVRNNAIGTHILAELSLAHRVENFVLVSTDKAVRPSNTMGASKRLAELILQGIASQPGETRFSMVRFGNVLGSSGSVVPLFREQIRKGGPVTVTHPEMTRFFMTIPEAAQLVMQAGSMARGGEVFVLDMGAPVKILDLARNMIELSGRTVRDESNATGDIEIRAVGLRPGEKLYEELLIGNHPQATEHPRIMMATEKSLPWEVLQDHLRELSILISAHDVQAIRQKLLQLVEEFSPTDDLVDWTHLAGGQRHEEAKDGI